ncbi:hypothetical protein MIMGU_mgv1a026141mg [Erythranthe guttata]|uniref:MATH domain-containing protein n=1 Tax=Erythranthe guttata TaxID=4155 RepID=A0A022RMB3_ERYGU|nr:hypothetical protein MIMGU_mgv1a021649mg [Erythranthe guttata]EYU41086.1 hypothetical protein MIMGU_mgv1a026141mg [Erythranthe guttata]
METREAPPAHLLVKIESFSLFEKYQIEKYETKEFAAGEYKWKLIIYPNGDDNVGKDSGYVSVYLAMVDTCSQPVEVNAVFSIFLFNHISGKYLSSLRRTRRFLGTKSKWGFSKFMSKESLTDPSNGYVIGDKSCVFGAEVFVAKKEAITQCVSSRNVDIPYKRDWIIPNYSKLGIRWESEEFGVGGEKWYYVFFLFNLFLELLRIKDQVFYHEYEKSYRGGLFTASSRICGLYKFIEIETMKDPKKGFIVNDSCLLQLEISSLKDVVE